MTQNVNYYILWRSVATLQRVTGVFAPVFVRYLSDTAVSNTLFTDVVGGVKSQQLRAAASITRSDQARCVRLGGRLCPIFSTAFRPIPSDICRRV